MDFLHGFFGGTVVFLDEVAKLFIAFRIDVGKGNVGHFDAEASHVETVGKRGENFERLFGDFLLFIWRKGGKCAKIMQTVGEFND